MNSIYDFIPIYGERVKITGWDHRRQMYETDCPECSFQNAHYRTFGSDLKFHVKETETGAMLRTGANRIDFGTRDTRSQIVNLTTFKTVDTPQRHACISRMRTIEQPLRLLDISPKYTSEFKHRYNSNFAGPKIPLHMKNEHYLTNRKMKSDLINDVECGVTCKFLDDHLQCPLPDNRLKRCFIKQKHTTYNPCLLKYGF